ncbi:MAG: hypothetical protein IPP31_01920 [Chitinophagaceae bacterium]|nr:hypothetical protein [Chitinophagaceae bacterium]
MKTILSLMVALCGLAFSSNAQTGSAKPKSATTKTVVKKKSPIVMPLMIRNEDGGSSLYDLKRGDKLVYHVNANGKEYDFIVTINDESYENGIDFNYEMTDPVNLKGHVVISGQARSESTLYKNYFGGGELKLTDACTVWLSGKNFSDMPDKKTVMTFDNGSPETFYRPEQDEVLPVVKVKGKDMKIEGFMISNAESGKGNKTLWVNGISSNPLILKMDLGWTIELKEIR